VSVHSLPPDSPDQEYVCNAYLTFVALGADGKSRPVPAAVPGTEEEKRRFAQAGIRREHRLVLQAQLDQSAGKP
jgi:acyl-CoA hydrolase